MRRLELSRTFGDEPPLLGLLRVYKEYYPDIIVGEESTRKQQCFEVSKNLLTSYSSNEKLIASGSVMERSTTSYS